MSDLQQLRFEDESSTRVMFKLLFFSLLMITMPLFLYFFTKSFVFEGMMAMTSSNSYFYAAIVAILAVHVVLGLFIYVAWKEGATPAKKAE